MQNILIFRYHLLFVKTLWFLRMNEGTKNLHTWIFKIFYDALKPEWHLETFLAPTVFCIKNAELFPKSQHILQLFCKKILLLGFIFIFFRKEMRNNFNALIVVLSFVDMLLCLLLISSLSFARAFNLQTVIYQQVSWKDRNTINTINTVCFLRNVNIVTWGQAISPSGYAKLDKKKYPHRKIRSCSWYFIQMHLQVIKKREFYYKWNNIFLL